MLPITIDACVCSDAPMAFVVDHQRRLLAGAVPTLQTVLSSGPLLDLLAVILMTNVKVEFFSAKIPAIITIFRSKKSTILTGNQS